MSPSGGLTGGLGHLTMIINNHNYFTTNDINIPNVGENTPIETGNQNHLQWYIDVYERELLIMALGRQLYQDFITNIVQDPSDPSYGDPIPAADPVWINLLTGTTYTQNSATHYWNGLRYTITLGSRVQHQSLIAHYIYYKYLKDNTTNLTNLGVATENIKNATQTDPTPKMIKAYRTFYNQYGGEHNPYVNPYPHHPNYTFTNSRQVTLYHFLSHHTQDYPNWQFTHLENQNQFNI